MKFQKVFFADVLLVLEKIQIAVDIFIQLHNKKHQIAL